MDRLQKEKWMALCEQAANEQNPEKFMQITLQITTFLEVEENKLKSKVRAGGAATDEGADEPPANQSARRG